MGVRTPRPGLQCPKGGLAGASKVTTTWATNAKKEDWLVGVRTPRPGLQMSERWISWCKLGNHNLGYKCRKGRLAGGSKDTTTLATNVRKVD